MLGFDRRQLGGRTSRTATSATSFTSSPSRRPAEHAPMEIDFRDVLVASAS